MSGSTQIPMDHFLLMSGRRWANKEFWEISPRFLCTANISPPPSQWHLFPFSKTIKGFETAFLDKKTPIFVAENSLMALEPRPPNGKCHENFPPFFNYRSGVVYDDHVHNDNYNWVHRF